VRKRWWAACLGAVLLAGQDFYRDSACVADRWVAEHGGKSAVLDLIRRVNAGESARILDGR